MKRRKNKKQRSDKGRKRKFSTRAKVGIGVAGAGLAAGGLIALKTRNKNTGMGVASAGNNSATRSLSSTARGNTPLLTASPKGGALAVRKGFTESTIPTTKLQSSQMSVVTKPNMLQRAGQAVSKVPGAKNAYMTGQQARMGYAEGLPKQTQSRLNRVAGKMGKIAGKGARTIRSWSSQGKS